MDNNRQEKDWLSKELVREKNVSVQDSFDNGNVEERKPKRKKKENDPSDPFFIMDIIIFSLIIPFFSLIPGYTLTPIYIMSFFMVPGLIIWEAIFKKFPPTWYFILALIVFIASIVVMINNPVLN